MYQQITLVGNLGGEPEMRYTPAGKPVTNFSVATSPLVDRSGRATQRTHNLVSRRGLGTAGRNV